MARSYLEDEEDDRGRPARPARRAASTRGLNNHGYSAHYAESPVIPQQDPPRQLFTQSFNMELLRLLNILETKSFIRF